MANKSKASAHWEDTLENGFGTISAESSQIFTETPYNFKARSESQAHITTPEELLGAAHAACFSMAFSMVLGQKGLVAKVLTQQRMSLLKRQQTVQRLQKLN